MVRSKLDSLSPELFVEIGDYLDGCDLYYSFYGLNQRINSILDEQCHRLHVNFLCISKMKFDLYCRQILPHMAACIASLTLSGTNSSTPGLLKLLLTRFSPLASIFVKLESFKLLDFTKSDVESLLPHLPTLTHLKYLFIGEHKRLMQLEVNMEELFEENVQLPMSLRSLAFPYEISSRWIQTSNTISFIEQLHIHFIHIDSLSFFLQRFPYLKRLTTVLVGVNDNNSFIENLFRSTITFPTLRYLNVNIAQDVLFDHFACFLRSVPQLQSLLLEALNPDLAFLDAHRWETVVPSNLSSFRFDLTMTLTENPDHLELLQPFKSQFWISRGWFVQCHLRDHGRFFRLSTVQSPIISTLYWPDDEILLDSTSTTVYQSVTHIKLWWNLSKSTRSICPNVRSIQLYGAGYDDREPFDRNICDLLQYQSLEHIIINNDLPITQFRFASVLVNSSDHVHILTCSTHWLRSMLEDKTNEWICLLITMRIRKLILVGDQLILSHRDLIAFSRTFINLQELTIKLNSSQDMFFLLNILQQLTVAHIELPEFALDNVADITKWIAENTMLVDFIAHKLLPVFNYYKLNLWIGLRHTENSMVTNDNPCFKHSIINEYILENQF